MSTRTTTATMTRVLALMGRYRAAQNEHRVPGGAYRATPERQIDRHGQRGDQSQGCQPCRAGQPRQARQQPSSEGRRIDATYGAWLKPAFTEQPHVVLTRAGTKDG